MTLGKLIQMNMAMSLKERQARYQDCIYSGGCEEFTQPISGDIAGDLEYCANCLTLFVNDVSQDRPSLPTPEI